jgi:hypothetical protein
MYDEQRNSLAAKDAKDAKEGRAENKSNGKRKK